MMHCSMNINIINHNHNSHTLSWFFILLILILQQQQQQIVTLSAAKSSIASSKESRILIKFKDSFENSSALSDWNVISKRLTPCTEDKSNWEGVLCDNGSVWGLKLENMGLRGKIDVDSLSELKSLRTISLMYNSFDNSLPNIDKLSSLKTIYLSYNKFSGKISSDAFKGMASLKKVHLAHNNFSGSIPSSLTTLPKLMELMLDHNLFEGQIPSFPQERLINVNFSSNHLTGRIPSTLTKLKGSSFSDNPDLCGAPLLKECPKSPRISTSAIVAILVAIFIAVCAIIAVIIILRRNKTTPQEDQEEQHITETMTTTTTTVNTEISPKRSNTSAIPSSAADLDTMERGMMPASDDDGSPQPSKKTPEQGNIKLTFLSDDIEKFDVNDLLKASAEILASGLFGSSYKASLTGGQTMVVKRYRQMNNVSKEEFQEHMRRLGGLDHPNLLPISAFYCKRDEKLFISRYINNVSLAAHLHGNKTRGERSSDWPTRLKIVKGVSKGLLYLYNSLPSLIAPHGHLKSSNVLLSHISGEPLLTDYGLIPVVNLEHAQEQMIAYKSPEFRQTGRITKKTDVWSLGILILEVLTGKFPSSFFQQVNSNSRGRHHQDQETADLSTWVLSVVKDDQWTSMDVFDPEMMKAEGSHAKDSQTQMIKLLKIALNCCEVEITKRLDIRETVEMIQEIKERDNNDNDSNNTKNTNRNSSGGGGGGGFYSSYTSDGDIHSSKQDFSNDF